MVFHAEVYTMLDSSCDRNLCWYILRCNPTGRLYQLILDRGRVDDKKYLVECYRVTNGELADPVSEMSTTVFAEDWIEAYNKALVRLLAL